MRTTVDVAELERRLRELEAENDALRERLQELPRNFAALQRSEVRYRLLADTMLQGVVHQNSSGEIIAMNPAAERILGWTPADALGRTSVDAERETIREDGTPFPGTEHPSMRALRTGTVVRGTVMGVLNPRLGEYRWIRVDAVPVFTPGVAHPIEVYTVFEDITASRLAEDELKRLYESVRAEKQRLSLVLDSITDEVWFSDLEGRVTLTNPAVRREFGPLDGRDVLEVAASVEPVMGDGQARPLAATPLARALAGELVRDDEESIRLPRSGELRQRQVTASPVRDAEGRIVGAVAVVRDVTERRRFEAELLAKEAALRDSDRRKDVFLATLSHELRNPLAPLRTVAEILTADRLDAARLEWARAVIQRQVGHMALLLDDLLDIARITQGKLGLKIQRTRLDSIIDAAIETTRPLLDEKRQNLVIDVPPESPLVEADPMRLSQVLSNLLTNAAKYSDRGGEIRLTARVSDAGLTLSVKDDGIGIDAASLRGIFQMFSQVDGTSARSEGGLGIGLALVKGIVELHGGEVAARSDGPGRGSEFLVALPWNPPRAGSGPVRDPATVRTRGATLRVLVADDNRDAADSLGLLLELSGHDVRVAHGGQAAIAVARSFQPDVAVLDIGMPDVSGFDVAACLRREPWAGALRLIAVTGWGQDADRERTREAGFDWHLTKPVDPPKIETLLATLRHP